MSWKKRRFSKIEFLTFRPFKPGVGLIHYDNDKNPESQKPKIDFTCKTKTNSILPSKTIKSVKPMKPINEIFQKVHVKKDEMVVRPWSMRAWGDESEEGMWALPLLWSITAIFIDFSFLCKFYGFTWYCSLFFF